jgi:hypothetical protein
MMSANNHLRAIDEGRRFAENASHPHDSLSGRVLIEDIPRLNPSSGGAQ